MYIFHEEKGTGTFFSVRSRITEMDACIIILVVDVPKYSMYNT